MFYEIDSDGSRIRPLPGYFQGFKSDLKNVDITLLSETQKDYLSISDNLIIEVPDEEHQLIQYKNQAQKNVSEMSYAQRSAILDDKTISNITIGATSGYPAYLTAANVVSMIEQFKAIAKQAKADIESATTKAEINSILEILTFPTTEQILSQINRGSWCNS